MLGGEMVLEGGLEVVPEARRFITEALAGENDDLVDAAELVASELSGNALLHGMAPVQLRVNACDGKIRIEVQDAGRNLPLIPLENLGAMTGRGLRLVGALSCAFGVEPALEGKGKVVWAELLRNGTSNSNDELEIDIEAVLAGWDDLEGTEPQYTVRLGAISTDLLLAAKSHIDNAVREAQLARSPSEDGDNSPELTALIETVTRGFASSRAEIKRQAVAAAARGDAETELVLTQPASAAEAGERYLLALDLVDRYAREARMLTLEAPPLHKIFRRWYVQSLVGQLRAKAAGLPAPRTRTFVEVLADEVAALPALQSAAARLVMLQELSAQLTGADSVEEIAAVVLNTAGQALGAVAGRVYVLEGEELVSVGLVGESPPGYDRVPLEADLPGPLVLRTREPLVLHSHEEMAARFPTLEGLLADDLSLHLAPLIIGEHVLGLLVLSFPVVGRLDESSQAAFVRALADALAQALERVLALEAANAARAEAELANSRLGFLADASVALGASLDYEETIESISNLLVPRLADWFSLQVLEEGKLTTVGIKHFDPVKLAWAESRLDAYPVDMDAPTGAPNVLRTGVSELYPEIPSELVEASAVDEEHLAMLRELGLSSAMVVPLEGRSGIFGAITLIHAESGRRYSQSDLEFLEDVSRRAALALEAARILRDQQGRLADVTRVAEAAQRAILAPPPDRIGPVRLEARYLSAAAAALVGGDLYEVVPREGAVRCLIGDVRGKGLAAVRTATVVLGEFRAAAADLPDLAEVARQIDRRIRTYLGPEDFVTALLAEITDDGTFRVAVCGHPPALLISGGEAVPIEAPLSLPLGLGADPRIISGRMMPGDRLLMMTDGLLEARCPDREFVDVAQLVASAGAAPLETALDVLLDALREAVANELGDDLALLVAEYTGVSH